MLSLYNTLTGKKEEFKPLVGDAVRMYVCGPTVYEYDHVGHARTYLSFDLLNRFLGFLGYRVTYIQNITDVGHLVGDGEIGLDKVQVKAREMGWSVGGVVDHYTEAHLQDLTALGIILPDRFPKASDHIREIIEFIRGLIKGGYAYATEAGNVYFSVNKKADYGKLSRRGLAEILTGTRVEPAQDKRSVADFALWKSLEHGPKDQTWESPWGRGFPGWHIECSAMSRRYLGDTFDIHGSAVEHVFPHHENELAQSESLTGKMMARFWVHAGMLLVNGSKMSRSVPQSMITIKDALKDHSANELRLAFYQTHYRRPFDYTKASLEQGVAWRKKLFTTYVTADLPKNSDQAVWSEVIEALNDDLDIPRALQVLADRPTALSREDTEKLYQILGLRFINLADNPEAVKLAAQRDQARERDDFLTADNRKQELLQLGFEVSDSPKGTVYIPR